MISKEKVKELVGIFYRNTFKVFYINSCDGENTCKPFGLFVSLGITTSPKVLEEIRGILEENGYIAKVCELSSKRCGDYQFINTLTDNKTPLQYEVLELGPDVMNEAESKERLKTLKDLITSDQDLETLRTIVPKVSRLEELINRLNETSGWNFHYIQETNNSFNIFHKFVNYKQTDDIEYRLGIYVSENSK
jgi:hypothetical protein